LFPPIGQFKNKDNDFSKNPHKGILFFVSYRLFFLSAKKLQIVCPIESFVYICIHNNDCKERMNHSSFAYGFFYYFYFDKK
jgi:hypothetical protein